MTIQVADPLVVAIATIGFYLGGVLKGTIGMGLPLVAISIVATVMPVIKAIPLMLAPGYIMNLLQMRQTWHARTSLLPWWHLLLGLVVGIAVGVYFAASAPEKIVKGVLGAVVLIYAGLSLARLELPESFVRRPSAGLSMGWLTGLSGGMTGGFGATLAMYLLACRLERDRFIWLIGVLMFLGSIVLGTSLALTDSLAMEQVLGSVGMLLPSWLELTTGGIVRKRVSQELFRKLALAALTLMGLSLVVASLR